MFVQRVSTQVYSRRRRFYNKCSVATTTATSSTTTSIQDLFENQATRVKKETIHLEKDDFANMYFMPFDADYRIKTRIISDKYLKNIKQERDLICAKAFNIKGELCLIQLWDNSGGVHAKYFEQLLRFSIAIVEFIYISQPSSSSISII